MTGRPEMEKRTLAELAALVGGTVIGDDQTPIRGVAGIREAQPGEITFIANSRYDAHLRETRASAVICSREPRQASVPLLQVDNPYLAFQRIVVLFRPALEAPPPGVHPTAVVAPSATIGEGASIGPYCVVESGASVGARSVLHSHCVIGALASVGEDCRLHAHVVVREECTIGQRCILHPGVVIGADGFGFAFDAGRYHKVPQVGTVIVGDDVEIGANTTIDRATTDATRIGDGTKIDNLVQIGHNVQIGRHCIIVAQVGISGSTRLEDHVVLGGQAGLVGHITVGAGAQIGAQAGVSKSVPAKAVWWGTPAQPLSMFKRLHAMLKRLPILVESHKQLEARVERLEKEKEALR